MGGRRNNAARSAGRPGHRTGGQGGRDRRRREPLAGRCRASLALVPAAAPETAPQAGPGRRPARESLCGGATYGGEVRRPGQFTITGLILTPVSVMARAIPADAAADDLAATRHRGADRPMAAHHHRHDAGGPRVSQPGLSMIDCGDPANPTRPQDSAASPRRRSQRHRWSIGVAIGARRKSTCGYGFVPVVRCCRLWAAGIV